LKPEQATAAAARPTRRALAGATRLLAFAPGLGSWPCRSRSERRVAAIAQRCRAVAAFQQSLCPLWFSDWKRRERAMLSIL